MDDPIQDLKTIECIEFAEQCYDSYTEIELQQMLSDGPAPHELVDARITEGEWLECIAAALDEKIYNAQFIQPGEHDA